MKGKADLEKTQFHRGGGSVIINGQGFESDLTTIYCRNCDLG